MITALTLWILDVINLPKDGSKGEWILVIYILVVLFISVFQDIALIRILFKLGS